MHSNLDCGIPKNKAIMTRKIGNEHEFHSHVGNKSIANRSKCNGVRQACTVYQDNCFTYPGLKIIISRKRSVRHSSERHIYLLYRNLFLCQERL